MRDAAAEQQLATRPRRKLRSSLCDRREARLDEEKQIRDGGGAIVQCAQRDLALDDIEVPVEARSSTGVSLARVNSSGRPVPWSPAAVITGPRMSLLPPGTELRRWRARYARR